MMKKGILYAIAISIIIILIPIALLVIDLTIENDFTQKISNFSACYTYPNGCSGINTPPYRNFVIGVVIQWLIVSFLAFLFARHASAENFSRQKFLMSFSFTLLLFIFLLPIFLRNIIPMFFGF